MVDTIWLEARRQLETELSDKDFQAWVEPLRAVRWAARELTVETPSAFFRDWVRRHFLASLEQAVSQAAGAEATVLLIVNRALDVPVPAGPPAPRLATVSGPAPASALARYTFENFMVGASNRVAYGAARAVAAQPGVRFNPLFIHGGVGLGKTHLLSAVAHGLGATHRGAVACLSAENFVNEMISALKRDRMEQFRVRFRRIEMLVVDDVQFLGGKMRSQEEFTHTFNALHEGRKQIVLASDRPPNEMPGIEQTLRNRFASGLLADVQSPDPALRVALVQQKAAVLGMTLAADVVAWLADHCCVNVRELEGALTRLDAFTTLSGRAITLGAAREALVAYASRNGDRPTVARIVGEVCQHFQLSRAEIASPRRTARVALPRQVAMYLCRQHTDAPLGAIGAELGGRDHSTVVHALSAIERRLQQDAALRQTVSTLEARLGA